MPLDAACLTVLVRELRPALEGARVDKIFQPGREEILLHLRGPEGARKLLLTANPSHPRLQFTELARENPAAPPMFCMLLRKHLTGARIRSVTQPPMERVVDLELEGRNELGDLVSRHLILEAMGRRSNLILTDEAGRITDCMRKVDAELSQLRPVLPGLFYRLPPVREDKRNPLETGREALEALLDGTEREQTAADWLLDHFAGLSPLLCRELAWRAGGETDLPLSALAGEVRARFLDAFEALCERIRTAPAEPSALFQDTAPKDFSFLPIGQYGDYLQVRRYDTLSQLLDGFYAARETGERVRQRGQELIRSLTNARNRTARKLQLQQKELDEARDREHCRVAGDLITANLYRMERGMSELTCQNYYDPEGGEITIPLDPLLTPQQNAAKYYKRYTKAKTAEGALTRQLEQGREELDYLESVLETVSRAEGERDLSEIRQELEDTGYLRRRKDGKKIVKRQRAQPLEFRSSAGLRISVGRNNTQNDQLTCKSAGKGDLWLHTQGIHGAHVILWTEGAEPDSQSVREAAMLAAWYSQGRESGQVPVDYTPVKYVKKPNGARPGMVIYTTYRTLYVTPDRELAEKLAVKK
ncbi:MAG TPA: NFACT family protein [Candidatus Onthomonas avicola]|nr:NFACT family protein [Candidatus Onthomonas avicola]